MALLRSTMTYPQEDSRVPTDDSCQKILKIMTDVNDLSLIQSADTSMEDELRILKERLSYLERREQELIKEKEEHEEDFGQKRARFKELFLQKEVALKQERDAHEEATQKIELLEADLKKLSGELEDIKTAAAVSEANKQDEVEEIRRHCEQEVASLQHIMKGDATDAASSTTASQYEKELKSLVQVNEELQQKVQDLNKQLSQEREGFLASVAKSLKRVSGGVTGFNTSIESESLEDSMRKAQEDAEILKSVVLPLEEEISSLKLKLKTADSKVKELEKQLAEVPVDDAVTKVCEKTKKSPSLPEFDEATAPEEKIQHLMKYLKAEKASRTDLEMYVAVLNTQKAVLQSEADTFRSELHEVCCLLEEEKREHGELKRTWQMANDQFLESQRLMMMDLRRFESVLTTEQQRQIAELQKKDSEREAQEKRVKELWTMREKQQREQEKRRKESLSHQQGSPVRKTRSKDVKLIKSHSESRSSPLSNSFDNISLENHVDGHVRKSFSSSDISSVAEDFTDSSMRDTQSLHEVDATTIRISPEKTITLPILTEAQRKAITDPTPETEAQNSLLASVKAKTDGISLEGRRIVSEKEWQLLEQELKLAREKLGRPCDMCNNYEAQLQSVQAESKDGRSKIQQLERYLNSERQAAENQRKYQDDLEANLKDLAEDANRQISTLMTKLQESEKFIMEVKQQFTQSHLELQEQLKMLTDTREDVQKELTKLEQENDVLVGKHSKHSQQLQNEDINLPNNLEDMQLLLLKYREEIIVAKVAKEHIEDTLKSEILFLKDRVLSEQQEKSTMEETLSQEISGLLEKLATLESVQSELERESAVRADMESKLRDSEQSLKNIQAKSKQVISAFSQQLDEQSDAKTKLESDYQSLKAKIQSLQMDLENSEAVQRDFVKLSQSLQIQLEKIRQAETEVRWQHEEDVDECNNCRQAFSVTRRKHHCRHCGRIFCADCTSKTVMCGPNMRSSKVCDVCHTILVKDATPYFSTEPPSTPH